MKSIRIFIFGVILSTVGVLASFTPGVSAQEVQFECKGETNGVKNTYRDGACYRDGANGEQQVVPWDKPVEIKETEENSENNNGQGGSKVDLDKGKGGQGECAGAKTDFLPCEGEGADAVASILRTIIFIVSIGVGITGVGGLVYAALLYTTAQDNKDQVKKSIGVIRNVMIAIALYAFMIVIINWLNPESVFEAPSNKTQENSQNNSQ